MKKLACILIFILCTLSISIANPIYIETHPLKKLDSTIININEPIKSIWLVKEDEENVDVKEAYDDGVVSEDIKNSLKYMASIKEEVDPFSEEDYVFNDSFDKKNYVVYYDIVYDYYVGQDRFHAYEKLRNKEELYSKYGNSEDIDTITCEREVTWIARKLTEVREIPVSEIIDGKLNIVLTDFSGLEKPSWDSGRGDKGYSIRFEKENGEYLTFSLNTSNVIEGTGTTDGERKEIIDYTKHSYEWWASYSTIIQSPLSISNSRLTIIIGALVIVTIIVGLTLFLVNKKSVGKSSN